MIDRVTSSKTSKFTKISQNMPTFQSPEDKATRPKAEYYNIYMEAYGPNHQYFSIYSHVKHILHNSDTTPLSSQKE